MQITSRYVPLAALLLALVPGLLHSAPTTTDAKEKAVSPAEKTKKLLDQTMSLEITDQSLNAALNQIREQTKINFVVDRLTIQQLGQDPEQMLVNVKLKDVKARSCLRAVLSPYNLGFAIIGDTVLISTDDVAMHRQMHQRVTIDLDKVDLGTALKQLAKETATNLLLDTRVGAKEAKTEVSLQLEDVPLETAVRLLAEMASLKPIKVGNVYLVTTRAVANELRNDPDLNGQNNNPPPNPRGDALQQWMNVQPNGAIFLNGLGQLGGNMIFAPNGLPIGGGQPGNVPIPALEKPAEKGADPGDVDKPAEPEKKPESSKPPPK